MRNPKVAFVTILVLVCLITLFIRIPLPSRGYFNFGDVAVVFGGLVLGRMVTSNRWLWGFGAGGVGSALADILGGFAIYSPMTLIAKGLEGAIASIAVQKKKLTQIILLIFGGISMVIVYFIGEALMPNIGYQGAVVEIIPNLIQAVGGIVGGRLTFLAYEQIIKEG